MGFVAARVLGALAALLSAGLLGDLIWKTGAAARRQRVMLLFVMLATSLPFGAWAAAGMETSVVMLLCSLAVWGFAEQRWWGALVAGLAAAWRPELVPWAVVMALLCPARPPSNDAPAPRRAVAERLLRLAIVGAPFVGVMVVRHMLFGSPVPLAVSAKPSDGAHGVMYAWGALRFLGFPILLLGNRAFSRLPKVGVALAVAFGAHVVAVVGVGGDWMSLFRLFVPLLPAMLWLSWLLVKEQTRRVVLFKGLVALGANLLLLFSLGASSRQVLDARTELIRAVSPLLADVTHVAALDVGWVGVATNGPITDLAGVTDPEVAHLPGGHTSKRLPTNLLARRRVDALILLLVPGHPEVSSGTPLAAMRFARAVENSLAAQRDADLFEVASSVPLRGTTQRYVILRKRSDAPMH